MSLDRRGFVKLAVGAAVGVHLTPLPWKIIDDVAIWTQNWPWVPRLSGRPNAAYAQTVCTLCEGGCGIMVRLVDSRRTIKVEGLKTAPVNQGKVCPMGAAGPQYQYSPARFQTPVRRIGARGAGAFVPISWEEALKEVGAKLAELRGRGRAHTVVLISGRRNDLTRRLSTRFMEAYGSPNLVDMPSLVQNRSLADQAQFGRPESIGYDLEHSKFILSFGCGLVEGWGSPVRSIMAFSSWRGLNRARLVQIDPQSSPTAAKADLWLPIAPGSETALALGMANIIIKKGWFRREFVEEHTFGFKEFAALVAKDYTPEKVAAICGVNQELLTALTSEFVKAKGAVALAGRGRGAIPTPTYELMAVMTLNALIGNINQPGGVIVRKDLPLAPWPEATLDQIAKAGLEAPRLDLAGSDRYPLTTSNLSELVTAINTGRLYPVEVLILDRANPDFFGADPGAFRAALARVPLVVSLSSLADDTSVLADIVLPEASNFEGPADVLNPPTLPFPLFGAAGPVLKKATGARPAGDIYLSLAKAVGAPVEQALPFKEHKEMVFKSAQGLFASGRGRIAGTDGVSFELGAKPPGKKFDNEKDFVQALAKGVFWFDPEFDFGDMKGAFATPSEKFEFMSQKIISAFKGLMTAKGPEVALAIIGLTKGADQLGLPHSETIITGRPTAKYPLLLYTVEQFKLVTSALGNAPYLTKLLEDTTLIKQDLVVTVNPQTAAESHLAEGDRAWLVTKKGRIAVRIHLFAGARPEMILAPIGLGHRGFDLYLKGKGANPMEIVEASLDPLSGQPTWWGTQARLIKA